MMHSFKNKELVLHAFISETNVSIYNFFPIQYAHKFYPDWWKSLPNFDYDFENMRPVTNMRACMGMVDLYKNSCVLPLWTDLALKWDPIGGNWAYNFADNITSGAIHQLAQRKGFKESHFHFKIDSPWKFLSDKNTKFHMTDLYYNFPQQKNYDIMPGVVDYYYQTATNINILIRPSATKLIIKNNTPLYLIKPLSERKLKLKVEVLSDKDFYILKEKTRQFSFYKAYSNMKKFIQKNDEERKCPFGFGK